MNAADDRLNTRHGPGLSNTAGQEKRRKEKPWWSGRTSAEILADPQCHDSLLDAAAQLLPAEQIAGPSVAAKLAAILRWGELDYSAA
jgi:hypothetical protein